MVRSGDENSQSQESFELSWSLIKWLESLQKSDQMFYNMMMLEIWSIAQTMDEISPGFWADYMKNRQAIMHEQLQERKQKAADAAGLAPKRQSSVQRRFISPFEVTLDPSDQEDSQLVSLFSQTFEQELPNVQRSVQFSPPTAIELGRATPPPPVDHPTQREAEDTNQVKYSDISQPFIDSHGNELATESASSTHAKNQQLVPKATVIPWLLVLPHLIHAPEVRVFPGVPSELPDLPLPKPDGFAAIVMACWLTRRFLVPVPLGDNKILVLQRLEVVDLEPGSSIVCQLGFRLKGVIPPVKVQLAKSLQQFPDLIAAWADQTNTTKPVTPDNPQESAIQLFNQGKQSIQLKAGQAFCRLEFRHYSNDN